MGWQDRDYGTETYGDGVSSTGRVRRPPNVTLALMILHGLAFFLVLMLKNDQEIELSSLFDLLDARVHPAAIFLHPFATGSIFTIVFTVLALWSLAGRLEQRIGPQRVVVSYVLGNLVAGAVFFALARLQPTLAGQPLDYPVGALAAMCVLAWHHLRHDAVQVLGRVMTVARLYAICAAIVVGLVLVNARQGAAAWVVAAFAGAASALLLRHPLRLRVPRRRTIRPSIPRSGPPRPTPEGPAIDEILAKISRTGLDSLTDDERRRLEEARRAKLRRDR